MKTVKQILAEKKKNDQDHLSKVDTRFDKKYPSDKEMPAVIVLKRKAIRVYPDHQKIAMYYSQALDKYISIPFGPNTASLGHQINESKRPKEYYDLSDVDPELADAADEVYPRPGKPKITKVTNKDVLKKLSPRKRAKYKGGSRMNAVGALKDYGAGRISGAAATGQVLGAAIGGLGKLAVKAYKKVRKLPEETENLEEGLPVPMPRGKLPVPTPKGKPPATTKPTPKPKRRRRRRRRDGDDWDLRPGNGKDDNEDNQRPHQSSIDPKQSARDALTPSSNYEFGKSDLARTSGAKDDSNAQYLNARGWNRAYRTDQVARSTSASPQQIQESNIIILKNMVENKIDKQTITIGENIIEVNRGIAKKVVNIYESLNRENKKKVEDMLNEDAGSFKKVINFAIKAVTDG